MTRFRTGLMTKYVCATLTAILVAIWLTWPSSNTPQDGQATAKAQAMSAIALERPSTAPPTCTSRISAFCRGEPMPLPAQTQRIEARRKSMRALGIATPDSYHDMGFAQLRDLSKSHDVYAMLQLAIRYRLEAEILRGEPGFDFKESPKEAEQRYWTEAITSGHPHSALILADQYWQEGKPTEALSWCILAQRMGDPGAEKWLSEKQPIVSPQDQTIAADRAVGLYNYVSRQQYERLAPH